MQRDILELDTQSRRYALMGPLAYSQEWYQARRWNRKGPLAHYGVNVVFGASDAAALCGISQWRTQLHVYQQALGESEQQESTFVMQIGHAVEGVVLKEYEASSGCRLVRLVPLLLYRDAPFIGATPDAIAFPGAEDIGGYPVDAKSAGPRMGHCWGEEGTDDVPVDVLMQAQQQMLVTGADYQHTVTWFRNSDAIRVYPIERNETIIASIKLAATEMYERLEQRDPPPPNWECPRTVELVKALHKVETMRPVVFDQDTAAKWQQQRDLGDAVKQLEKERQKLRAECVLAMGVSGLAWIPGDSKEITRTWRAPVQVSYERKGYYHLGERKKK